MHYSLIDMAFLTVNIPCHHQQLPFSFFESINNVFTTFSHILWMLSRKKEQDPAAATSMFRMFVAGKAAEFELKFLFINIYCAQVPLKEPDPFAHVELLISQQKKKTEVVLLNLLGRSHFLQLLVN